jgi:hypothetical protein
MFSKSIFGNYSKNEKSIINPVRNTTIPFYNNELKFSIEEYLKLNNFIEAHNENIFEDTFSYDEYIDLLNIISNLEIKTTDESIQLLLKITSYGLHTMIAAFGINKENIEINIKNMILQSKIESIISNINSSNSILITKHNNNYNLTKQFTLSPLFSYYISIYGIPEKGLGFDIKKLQLLKTILETNFINPYI